VHKLDYITRT